MNKYVFRLIAYSETSYWHDLPLECKKVYGVYLFCVGERTHCCSLTPSSWCEFIENVFVGLPSDHPFDEEYHYTNNGSIGDYFGFIDPEHLPLDRVSRGIELEAEDRDDAWEQAREYFGGNSQDIPCLTEGESA